MTQTGIRKLVSAETSDTLKEGTSVAVAAMTISHPMV